MTDDACRIHAPADDHHDTCPTCLSHVRDNLDEIARLVAELPDEAITKGLNSEAANLLGPASDPERDGHIAASIAAGRVRAEDYETATTSDLLHPQHVIGCWDMLVRDALDHPEPDTWTITDGIAYLDLQLTYLAAYPHLPFNELAADIRACRLHLEHVLHDGQQRDTGAPCTNCRTPLVRIWTSDKARDGWGCPTCASFQSHAEYEQAVADRAALVALHEHALHLNTSQWLTPRDIETRTGVNAGTVRVWANRGRVRRWLDSSLVSVGDTLARRDRKVSVGSGTM